MTGDKREGCNQESGLTRLSAPVTRAGKLVNMPGACDQCWSSATVKLKLDIPKPDNEKVLIPFKSSAVSDCQII